MDEKFNIDDVALRQRIVRFHTDHGYLMREATELWRKAQEWWWPFDSLAARKATLLEKQYWNLSEQKGLREALEDFFRL